MHETTIVDPSDTFCNANEPSSVVVTPRVVPFTIMPTPGMPCPEASATRPEIERTDFVSCAEAVLAIANDTRTSIARTNGLNSR